MKQFLLALLNLLLFAIFQKIIIIFLLGLRENIYADPTKIIFQVKERDKDLIKIFLLLSL